MNDLLQHAGFLQTAFTQVEGELRSEALFRRGGVTQPPPDLNYRSPP
jgi:hypothetical protein